MRWSENLEIVGSVCATKSAGEFESQIAFKWVWRKVLVAGNHSRVLEVGKAEARWRMQENWAVDSTSCCPMPFNLTRQAGLDTFETCSYCSSLNEEQDNE